MEVGHKRTDVPSSEAHIHGFPAGVDEVLGGLVALGLHGVVDAVRDAAFGEHHVGVRQEKFPHPGVKREAVHPVPSGVHQHGAGPVQDVPCGHLGGARLQEVLVLERLAHGGDAPHNAEDGADADVHVDVGGPVQRVDQHDVLAGPAFTLVAATHVTVAFLRADAAHALPGREDAHECVVGEDVEFLLLLVLNVGGPGSPEDVGQPGPVDLLVHDFRRHPDVGEQTRELARHKREFRLPVHDELAKSGCLDHCRYLLFKSSGPSASPAGRR